MNKLTITPGQLSLSQLRKISRNPTTLSLDQSAIAAIEKSAAVVQQIIAEDRVVYGINTGFGLLANTRIPKDKLE